MFKGFGASFSDVDWDSPDYDSLAALQNNVWQFSAAKTHTQLRDMGKALIDANGKIREYNDFKREAENIAGVQMRWLRTEYDSAIGGAQMAAKWKKIQAEKELFPLLQFIAVIDGNTSDLCRSLHKVIRPVDDPFWLIYFPPNHFNCRTTVKQLKEGTITPIEDIVYPEKLPAMYKVNLGERGFIFPAGHAYYTDVPLHVVNNATLYMPKEQQYLVRFKSADGTELRVHRKTELENKGDLADLLNIGKLHTEKGITFDILPEIYASETALRKKLMPGYDRGTKNPDAKAGGQYAELKKPESPNTQEGIQGRIAAGTKQADFVIVQLTRDFSESELSAIAKERFGSLKWLKQITFVTQDGEFYEYKKP